ncbi:Ig-like domain-containing protein [Terriglobus albidus]|uniref:Ig-like domain-containing protein n=1 Tax=Terriglobus albidus TaxID=1592106 RepID=UPI0021DFB9C8|nr:Ig-like domain-containing protein [Terriglobus albidus]
MRRSLRKILISSAPHLFCVALASGQVNASGQAPGRVDIQQTATTADSATIRIKLPGDTQAKSLQVNLNGKDISRSFTPAECSGGTCEQAVLTTNEGLRDSKNVLSVNAGNGITGRLRFDHSATANSSSPMVRSMALTSGIHSQSATITGPAPFLPPTLTFKTNYNGGWDNSRAWFTIGGQAYPDTTKSITGCPSVYVAVVLDRLALNQTDARCFGDSVSLKTYLQKLTAADLVVVGTMTQQKAAASLDLTPIGGTDHTSDSNLGGIMAIGAGGASAGSAYESYFDFNTTKEIVVPFASGTLQEDAYGFYDFQSSEVREFTVSPNDPSYLTSNNTSAISVSAPAGNPNKFFVYMPPSGANGYWLLTLSRYSLNTYPYNCAQTGGSSDGSIVYVTNCGMFYNTGSSNPATSKAAYLQLATDIAGVTSSQLGFLTTVGQAAYGGSNGSIWSVGGFNGSYGGPSNGFLEFWNALEAVGGTPGLTEQLLTPTSAYTFVFSPGMGGPLAGNGIESTTVLTAQGQTGLVHGILERNLNGLFTPQQTNQETNQSFQAKGGLNSPEFVLQEAAMQQPVEWPSSSQTTLLQGASTIQGQVAAYQYLSYVLLTKIYMPGLTGSHLDDIHYFFTGSYNTAINYHNYDVINIQWPGLNPAPTGPYVMPCQTMISGTQCSITLPNGEALLFTEGDFLAVRNQLRTEIQYLTNTLQFLVTGSNNMKDAIAAGNSNAGLALTGAAATILGSKLVPVAQQPVVHVSWQNIVSMVGGIASTLSAIPGIGEVAGVVALGSDAAKIIGGTSSAIGGVAGIAAGAGQISSTSSASTLPSAFSKFAINIGDLANENMQDQLSVGFNAMTDSITSDWGRLSLIGPMVLDSNNPVFFAPNQVAQNVAIKIMTQAASRSFYLDLMPDFYHIHYWEGVAGDERTPAHNMPDMGWYHHVGSGNYPGYYCKAFYLNPNENGESPSLGTIPPLTSLFYPTPAGTPQHFQYDYSYWPINYYVIAGSTTGAGSDDAVIAVLDPSLSSNLFTSTGLNLPIDEFVTKNGPMHAVWIDGASTNPSGESVSSVCNANVYPSPGDNKVAPEYWPPDVSRPPADSTDPDIPTTTSLVAPSTVTSGASVALKASVITTSGPVTAGQVYFTDNGSIISTVALDQTGAATVTLTNLALGQHTLQAKYGRVDGYDPSSSPATTLEVYANAPSLDLSLSSISIQAPYDGTSAPIALQLTSMAGLAGTVNLSCTGLPVGMTCNFNPSQVQLSAGGVATVTLTVSGSVQQASFLPMAHGFALVFGPVLILLVWRIRGNRRVPVILTAIVISALTITGLTGCSGSSGPFKESGTKTVMVNAAVGKAVTSQPLVINIQ